MRGLVEDTKKTKLSSTINNNVSSNSSSGSNRLKSASTVAGSSASSTSAKPLRSAVKTPTMSSTTSFAAGAAVAKKAPQTGQQQVGKSAKSSAAAAATTTTGATATTRAATAAAKAQKGQNPPPQQVQPKQQQQQQQQQTQQQPLVLPQQQQQHQANNSSNTIALPKASHANTSEELAGGVQDTIYLCNFRVSVDGEWLCLKELQDIDVAGGTGSQAVQASEKLGGTSNTGFGSNFSTGSNSSKRNSKRFSGMSTGSGGGAGGNGGVLDITDNGIMAIENLIGRRLSDMVHSGSSALGQSQSHSQSQHQSVGLFAEWSHLSRDTAEIERSNLVNICKLVVKELLEQSLRYGRMLDSDHLPLQHFFIVIEHVLGHGLRPKKGLLGPRKELWDLLQSVEHYCPEAQDITASVRDLPTVRTHIGRARAWLRIALMQKKLSDYLQALIEHREDSLYDYYEPHALMMSDEIVVIMGILVGLNVIDCNLCVKEEDLDSQQGVIDFSLYLRSSSRNADAAPEDSAPPALLDATGQGNMIAVLDQKNYIEELNRHLNATVGNLQAKVESLTTTNALMKEDLAIARNSLLALQAENQAMRQSTPAADNNSTGSGSSPEKDKEKSSEELIEERRKTSELEKELKLQVSLKAESDMAMKLLEKDIHEKQDTIISLRRQLDDIKQINLEMYRKLQDCKASLTHKTELMTKLELQKEDMASTIDHLEKKWTHDKSNLGEILKTTSQTLTTQVTASEERAARAEAESRIEREWRISLQEKELKLKEKISNLQGCLKELAEEKERNGKLKADLDKVRTQWSEAQTTLEELGIQLSVSKLKVSEMQDQERRQRQLLSGSAQSLQAMPESVGSPGIWAPDSIATHCTACEREFNLTRRKHHCRSCGEIFCKACSEHTLPLINAQGQPGKPVRVCDNCYAAK
ncbi:RUN and FYVE domain-containing protein 2 isoform X1 [Drosophila elegans]|uniref:RUN and FYVE domain-containing protein 2 isoform X1 n=1 Tax=Drosophila elegans TaxID=30023 RepID=UPI0007E75DEE|nr:RUN and FYVE domain-containing protein 2 isoform X1 [Drosophila elegans]XP_017129094.1 RUN and FYVE domain-containing protein 2 isoform X1 [Drosophila elegans]XP_041565136.1 RUN and FYVE domain-containing protein 2 isoform X1 [Drosophila elegans]